MWWNKKIRGVKISSNLLFYLPETELEIDPKDPIV